MHVYIKCILIKLSTLEKQITALKWWNEYAYWIELKKKNMVKKAVVARVDHDCFAFWLFNLWIVVMGLWWNWCILMLIVL